MKRTLIVLGTTVLMSLGLLISCGDDEKDFAQNNNQNVKPDIASLQKLMVAGPNDTIVESWEGIWKSSTLECIEHDPPRNCGYMRIKIGSALSAVSGGFGDAIDNGNPEPYITENRDVLNRLFSEELMDNVLSGESTVRYESNEGKSTFIFSSPNYTSLFVLDK
ncbi:MAG: hypothetical protein LBR17_05600 [Bacteroidales bacterium]|jgi:hypothetical protein|nr:hypothetical protein [Bacteroidales bacterium]